MKKKTVLKSIAILFALLLTARFCLNAQELKLGKAVGLEQLTFDEERYSYLQWSPDGELLSFSTEANKGLFVMDFDKKTTTKLTDDMGVGFGHQWSIDNERILYRATLYENSHNRKQYVGSVDLDGSKKVLSEEFESIQPGAWLVEENTQRVVLGEFTGSEKFLSRQKLNVNNKKRSALIDETVFNISFLFDEGRLYLIDPSKSNPRILLNEKESYNPVLSPSGKKVAFTEGDVLTVMNSDGSEKKQFGYGHFPSWINNSQVVFEVTTDDGHHYTSGDIYMLNVDSGDKVNVSNSDNIERYPVVSPDGGRIAFVDEESGQIFMMRIR